VPTVPEKSGSEILKFDRNLYNTFQNIQKCAFVLKCDFYIYGHIIHELLSHRKQYNHENAISAIFVSKRQEEKIIESIKDFFKDPVFILNGDRLISFRCENRVMTFYFIPDFDPKKINSETGFTIDQIYYDVKNNKLIDTTNYGIEHFSSIPLVVKSTVSKAEWDQETLYNFLLKVGTYYDSTIDVEDFENLKKMKINFMDKLGTLFWLNRPGTAIMTLMNLFDPSKYWIFDVVLKLAAFYKIEIKENIKPTKVLDEKKLKLLDLYTDYFNSSGSHKEKTEQGRTLIKLLISVQ